MITRKFFATMKKRMETVFPLLPGEAAEEWYRVVSGWEPIELEAVVTYLIEHQYSRKDWPAPAFFTEALKVVREETWKYERDKPKRADCQICDGTGWELTRPDPARQNLAKYCSCEYGRQLRSARIAGKFKRGDTGRASRSM